MLKISNTEKKGWWNGSSNRAPAYQVWGPEFKPQYHQKKKKKKKLQINFKRKFCKSVQRQHVSTTYIKVDDIFHFWLFRMYFKGWQGGSRDSDCLASLKSWVQTPVPLKKGKYFRIKDHYFKFPLSNSL
jgi:hypothetical protein